MNFKLLFCISFCYLNSFYVNSAILKQEFKENSTSVCVTQDCIETAALIANSIDDTVDPCDDFYKYACGNWQKEHFIPVNTTYRYSHFVKLSNEIQTRLDYKLKKGYEPGEPVILKKLYNSYNSCIDIDSRNKIGLKDLKGLINSLGGWPMIDSNWNEEKFHWEDAYVIVNQIFSLTLPFELRVMPNIKNTSQNVLALVSPYTSFSHSPQLDGIIKQEDPFEIFPKFDIFADQTPREEAIAADLKGSPVDHNEFRNLTLKAQDILSTLKKASSKIRYNETNLNEWYKQNWDQLLWSVDKLKQVTPNINWDKILTGLLGQTNIPEKILVVDSNFTKKLNNLVKEIDKRALTHYYALNMAMRLVQFTTEKYHKQFISTPLATACPQYITAIFRDLLSKLYLTEFDFGLKQRTDIQNMVQILKSSFDQILDANTWMDPATKKIAKEKLTAIRPNVAAPDVVFDDKNLEEEYKEYGQLNQSYLLNIVKGMQVTNKRVFDALKQNPKHTSNNWPAGLDLASIVNAFYSPTTNQIFLPAGIAQIPFYAVNRPLSVNLGSLGIVIGHELTHGFDNRGSQYDLHGAYKNWWTKETYQKFQTKNQCFVKQYSRFLVPEANKTVNGQQTLGENISDNGGMREAFYALQNYKKQLKGQSIDKLPGDLAQLSDEKVFFLSFAAQWCESRDPVSTRTQLLIDVHSPAHARVVLSLANFDEFAKTYNCPVNSKMNPAEKCIVW